MGADLSAVVREAGTIAIKRWLALSSTVDATSNPTMELADLVAALPTVRPSAMRSLFVESPPIKYSDIGGQASVIQKLKEAVEWPLVHPEAFQRLGVKPPKGILLYGPPGCSKTVLARACACESGVNFLAVKGPEVRPLRPILTVVKVDQPIAAEQIRRRIRTSRTRDIPQGPGSLAVHHLLCAS